MTEERPREKRNFQSSAAWERFGDEIRRTIQDAVDNRDFSRLNQTVSDTIGRAMDNVTRGMQNGGWYRENPMKRGWGGQAAGNMNRGYGYSGRNDNARKPAGEQPANEHPIQPAKKLLYLKGTSTKIGGMFLAVTGYFFAAGAILFSSVSCAWSGSDRMGSGIEVLYGNIRSIRRRIYCHGPGRNQYGVFCRKVSEIC